MCFCLLSPAFPLHGNAEGVKTDAVTDDISSAASLKALCDMPFAARR